MEDLEKVPDVQRPHINLFLILKFLPEKKKTGGIN